MHPVEIVNVLRESLDLAKAFSERFIVPDDFLEHRPDREQMVVYLKALSWKGTTSGAADSARVAVYTVEKEWRKLPEFVEMERMAYDASTDLAEETALMMSYVGGNRHLIERVLKGRRADVYSDRQEVTGKGGGPVEFTVNLGGVPRAERLE